MVRFYADEQYPYPVVKCLRILGHDVLTVQEAGNGNQRISDPDVLAFATQEGRAVLTQNRKDFIRLHQQQAEHAGIIACTNDRDWQSLANRIDESVAQEPALWGKLIRIVRPSL
jgi:predicted nuclease of predicted toxin-antitoxin system